VNISECLEAGLLKRMPPDRKRALASLQMAEHKLGLAEKELESGIFENAVVTAYSSMFHSARALLFKDGLKERSHYAIFVYVDEKYSNRLERRYLNEFNFLRLERHELLYGIDKTAETKAADAKHALAVAKGFLAEARKLAE